MTRHSSLLEYLQFKDYPSILYPDRLESVADKKILLRHLLRYIHTSLLRCQEDIHEVCDPLVAQVIFQVVHACHNLLGSLCFKTLFITHVCSSLACQLTHRSRPCIHICRQCVTTYISCFVLYLEELEEAIDQFPCVRRLDLCAYILQRIYGLLEKAKLHVEICARAVTGESPNH